MVHLAPAVQVSPLMLVDGEEQELDRRQGQSEISYIEWGPGRVASVRLTIKHFLPVTGSTVPGATEGCIHHQWPKSSSADK